MGGGKKKNASNVFSMFEPSQIQEFKEAFGMIDANRDGIIDVGDLQSTFESLGVDSMDSKVLEGMVSEAPAQINFTVFLNMLADKLTGTDPEDVILSAFKLFDPEGKGTIKKEYLGEVLTSIMDAAPIDAEGNLDYKGLAYIITHGEQGEEEAAEEITLCVPKLHRCDDLGPS